MTQCKDVFPRADEYRHNQAKTIVSKTMYILDFENSPHQAFLHGFAKGLAAPVCLYHIEPPPVIPHTFITPPSLTVRQAIESDWARVGSDFNEAVSRYGAPTK